jgi:hypothetical protein
VKWTKKSSAQASTDLPLGLILGKDQTELFLLGHQSGKIMLSQISASTGAPKWTF